MKYSPLVEEEKHTDVVSIGTWRIINGLFDDSNDSIMSNILKENAPFQPEEYGYEIIEISKGISMHNITVIKYYTCRR